MTRQYSALFASIMAVQLIFWLLVKPYLFDIPSPQVDSLAVHDISEAELSRPTYSALATANFRPIAEFNAENCCELGYRALRYHIDLDTVPEHGLGIYPNVNADNYSIYVNGSFVFGEGRMDLPENTFNNLIRKVSLIPPAALKSGDNEIVVIMVRDGVPYFDYRMPIIAEYKALEAGHSMRSFMLHEYKYIVLSLTAMICLFCLVALMRATKRREIFWFFAVSAGWALLSFYYIWIDRVLHGAWHMSLFFVVSLFISYAWFGWAYQWSRESRRWPLVLATATFGLLAIAMLYALFVLPSGQGFDLAGDMLDYGSIAFTIATVVQLLWHFRSSAQGRALEAAIVILIVLLFALNAVSELTTAVNAGYVNRTQPLLIVALAIAFFARNFRLFQSSAQINELLQTQLVARTAELEAAHARETQLVRRQAHEDERQRIMRDMHDGLGSNLMSMLLAARRGIAEPEAVAEGLQSVVDEMRLMIDSMDSVGESLATALATFRGRVADRVTAAGFKLDWRDSATRPLPDYSPRAVLQVFRVMQEAVTNALKHSGGDTIAIVIADGPGASDRLSITIADNGGGKLGAANSRGRGLDNMRTRAASIGAQIAYLESDTGLAVRLDLPENAETSA